MPAMLARADVGISLRLRPAVPVAAEEVGYELTL